MPRSRPPGGLLARASGLGLSALLGCDAELYHDLPERRANEAVLALRESGVRADKRLEQRAVGSHAASFAVTVARTDEPRALRLLAERGLPRLVSIAAPASSPLWGGPSDGRSEATSQLQAALSETLESLPAVQEARVHLALPEPEPLHPLGQLRPTASVLLRLRAPLPLPAADVALLVARAVPGLDAADVAVVSTPPTEITIKSADAATVSSPAWVLALLVGICVALVGVCVALLTALRARARRPDEPATSPAPEVAAKPKPKLDAPPGRRAFS